MTTNHPPAATTDDAGAYRIVSAAVYSSRVEAASCMPKDPGRSYNIEPIIRADLAQVSGPAQQEQNAGAEEAVAWRCFHCDETFTDPEKAREHFGDDMLENPACKLSRDQRGLVGIIREQKRELDAYGNERDALAMNFYALGAQHETKLREAEQVGYDRGLADGRTRPATQPPAGEDAAEALKDFNHCLGEDLSIEALDAKTKAIIRRSLTAAAAHDAERVALARALVSLADGLKLNAPQSMYLRWEAATIDLANRILGEART